MSTHFKNRDFELENLENILRNLNISRNLVDEIIIRYETSPLLKELVNCIKKENPENNIQNIILEFLLVADKMKLITCNKKQLSKLTDLTERRRARQIPFIQLTGRAGTGRKVILYDPLEIVELINKNRVKALN